MGSLSRIHAVGNAATTPAENAGAQGKARDPHWRRVTFWRALPERSSIIIQASLCGLRVSAGVSCCIVPAKCSPKSGTDPVQRQRKHLRVALEVRIHGKHGDVFADRHSADHEIRA